MNLQSGYHLTGMKNPGNYANPKSGSWWFHGGIPISGVVGTFLNFCKGDWRCCLLGWCQLGGRGGRGWLSWSNWRGGHFKTTFGLESAKNIDQGWRFSTSVGSEWVRAQSCGLLWRPLQRTIWRRFRHQSGCSDGTGWRNVCGRVISGRC